MGYQQLIDGDGYRQNVGIVIFNNAGQVLWARRIGQNSWQFPQGGIKHGENPEGAMYRELKEELGLSRNDVTYIQSSRSWLKYNLPARMVHWDEKPVCVGQRQKWFLLRINEGADRKIAFHKSPVPAEFDDWRWVSLWYPIRQVVAFKKDVYRKILKEFSQAILFPETLAECRASRNRAIPECGRSKRRQNGD